VNWSIEAPAKINLTLECEEILAGGYHRLDTIFTWLELADQLRWTRAARTRLRLSGTAGGLAVSADEDNLVLRALRLLEQASARRLNLDIELEKRIPAGGGLGGGSSDAAALLYGVNLSEQLGISEQALIELASGLGADVAFCLQGGTARGRHRGERLSALPPAPSLPVVLVFPPFGCPTGQVYREWDRTRPRPARGNSEAAEIALRAGSVEQLLARLANDLQPAAEKLWPELSRLSEQMSLCGADRVLLSGSGSTLLGFTSDPDRLRGQLAEQGVCALASRIQGLGRPAVAALRAA
jgi:4-diphosphocytidyl-2-C-methyl-D-erythritol kinase